MIRHPVWTSLSHPDYIRAVAWTGVLGVDLGEVVAMFAAAGIAAVEGGPKGVHTVEPLTDAEHLPKSDMPGVRTSSDPFSSPEEAM